ncbi:MAG: EAL domain-containing response regulator [Rhizobiales bacterium]|nr:EAL domain-containing response regulator [Hyphomicrobiales bacterium]
MHVFENVLIIDDDPILRAISQAYFAALNVKSIYVAGDGRKALQIICDQAGDIDFILCDLNMPELDGVEFLRHLKDHNYRGSVGIVSGEDMSVLEIAGRLAKTYELNIAGMVQKPLRKPDFDELIANAAKCLEEDTASSRRAVTPNELAAAIEADQIVPYYQPKIAVADGRICGVEALARWQHPDTGLVAPDLFIPCAEESGLIGPMTQTMINQTVADAARWTGQKIDIHVAINITPHLLEARTFPDKLASTVHKAGLQPSRFTFEITERTALQSSPLAMEVVARLRLKGFDISIDDFGTGMANLEQLRDFPYSELKIDRSFVQGATDDRFARACLKASAVFARELDMRLVAEGVSNQAEWNMAVEEAVDEVQGFLIARPMPASEFEAWYKSHEGVVPLDSIGQLQDDTGGDADHCSLDAVLRLVAG